MCKKGRRLVLHGCSNCLFIGVLGRVDGAQTDGVPCLVAFAIWAYWHRIEERLCFRHD